MRYSMIPYQLLAVETHLMIQTFAVAMAITGIMSWFSQDIIRSTLSVRLDSGPSGVYISMVETCICTF